VVDFGFGPDTVVVTGAGSGIGRAIALLAAGSGLRVCAWDVAADGVTRTVDEIVANGGEASAVVADVTDPRSEEAFRAALDVLDGELDLLANVAGTPGRADLFVELDDAAFEEAFALHVVGPARLMRLCHRALASAGGAVVNLGSISGAFAAPRSAPYSAAKAALVALTRATAVEWARDGIRVNAVEPGYVATGFNAALVGFEDRLLAKIPTRRSVSVDSVAQTVLFAASNVDMTGEVLRVDGGQTVKL
jgi:NAD(P)-dependent dehydrogenase (short-subunit alcohol dehydrogenase family)